MGWHSQPFFWYKSCHIKKKKLKRVVRSTQLIYSQPEPTLINKWVRWVDPNPTRNIFILNTDLLVPLFLQMLQTETELVTLWVIPIKIIIIYIMGMRNFFSTFDFLQSLQLSSLRVLIISFLINTLNFFSSCIYRLYICWFYFYFFSSSIYFFPIITFSLQT